MLMHERVVLVTGGSAGIGAACAEAFTRDGAVVIIWARGEARLNQTVSALAPLPGKVYGMVVDVADHTECSKALDEIAERFGRLDVLVNNAGLHHRGSFTEHSADELSDMVRVNLISPIRLCRQAMPLLQETQGTVVNIASLAGCVPVPGSATYSAPKFGLRAFSMALALEMKESGVQVCLISPGPVDTGFIMDDLESVTDITFSQPIVSPQAVADAVYKSVQDGKIERKLPKMSGYLTTIAYLFPFLRHLLRPFLERKGARVKRRLLRTQAAHTRKNQ